MKFHPTPGRLIVCLLAVWPLLTAQRCGEDPGPFPGLGPGPTPDPGPDPTPDPEPRVTVVYGPNLVELTDGSVWEVTRITGATLTVGTEVRVDETSLEDVLTGERHPARLLGTRVRSSSINQILNFGEIVELVDGSSWRVDGPDQAVVSGWFPLDDVLLVSKPTIGDLMIREADGRYVRVNLN